MAQTRPPLVTKYELRSYHGALNSQALGRTDHLLDGLDRFPIGIGRGPAYDYPNPSWAKVDQRLGEAGRSEGQVWSNRLLNLLLSRDTFFTGAGRGPVYDYPNPRGAIPGIALRTHVDPLKLTLAGKDKFFASAGMGPDYDWPNPRGAIPSIELRTFLGPLNLVQGTDKFFGLAGHPMLDWPVPRGAQHAITLRTHLDPLKLPLRSKDVFFGLAGNPTFDWPVPKGRPQPYLPPPPNELPTLFAVIPAPFHLLDWPNPAAARDRGIAARAWNEGWQNPIVTSVLTMPLVQNDWPLPRGYAYPADLRVYYPAPFIGQPDFGTITDTDILHRPVNVMMAGDLPIKDHYRESDIRPPAFKTKTTVSSAPPRRLKGGKPSFTVKTDKRGYD